MLTLLLVYSRKSYPHLIGTRARGPHLGRPTDKEVLGSPGPEARRGPSQEDTTGPRTQFLYPEDQETAIGAEEEMKF